MTSTFRIIDTGVREGRANIAFDPALIELRQQDKVPDTIRFMRFPPTALIGRHQDLSREIDLDYCEGDGVGVVRRVTGDWDEAVVLDRDVGVSQCLADRLGDLEFAEFFPRQAREMCALVQER